MEKTVLPIHFEDRSGTEFERLAFAYLTRLKDWDIINWLGQTGSDGGRDIWAEINEETFCYQCANYRTLTEKKAIEDIEKLAKKQNIPNNYIVICGGNITNRVRDKISEVAKTKGIKKSGAWTGREFEEKLRKDTPELIKRYVEGETFPDFPNDLTKYAKSFSISNDADIVELIAQCFDRAAFTTRFRRESSMPDFEKALKDTIEVLNTGVHRLRDGTIIRTIPSRHQLSDNALKNKLSQITTLVVYLRDEFVRFKRSGDIEACGCNQVDCPVYMLTDKASEQMDVIREDIFKLFKDVKPDFNLQLY
jgi:hypothetical protein